jgi:hypothetical protein
MILSNHNYVNILIQGWIEKYLKKSSSYNSAAQYPASLANPSHAADTEIPFHAKTSSPPSPASYPSPVSGSYCSCVRR